jgi:DNA polymerase III alpha subunit
MEVVLYSNEYQRFAEWIKPDALLFFEGTVDKTREEPSFKAREIYTLDSVQKKKTREILVRTSSVKLDDGTMTILAKLLADNKGGTPVKLELSDLALTQPVRVQVQLGTGINLQGNGVQALKALFGENEVLALGPNRKVKRAVPATIETPLIAPSDELVEVG